VIQPKEGEINYDLFDKKPEKFYDKVMSQDVTEHKVSKGSAKQEGQNGELAATKKGNKKVIRMSSRITKRPVGRVLNLVSRKLRNMVFEAFKDFGINMIDEAMEDPDAQQVVQQIIADGGIKLRNKENNATIFKKQMD